jgi:hypothetical protein
LLAGFAAAGLTREKRSFHDRLSRTRVVRDGPLRAAAVANAIAALVVLALVAGGIRAYWLAYR